MRLYTHPACLRHSAGPGHPEAPARLAAVLEALQAAELPGIDWHEAPLATHAQLLRAHDAALVRNLLDHPVGQELRRLDADTAMNAHSAEAALRAAGAACAAVDAVLRGETTRAFCAVRPPGHHATRAQAMGFCLFNSMAIAAQQAITVHGLQRVALVDFDVHHGNGSQDIFWNEPRVMYISSHQQALYPGTGDRDERGERGNIINAPLREGSGSAELRRVYAERLLPILDDFRPQLLLISAGFDAHRLDPLAGLNLDAADYGWLTSELVAIADRHAGGRVVSALEGGYSLSALRDSSVAHVRALLGAA
jgi:acetoin utilization deacetylase AcuC-like enzyme